MKTYVNKDSYLFIMYKPLSSEMFLSDTLLTSLLFNNLGEKYYKEIVNKYKEVKINFDEYKEITKNLDDVFRVEPIIKVKNNFNSPELLNIEFSNKLNLDDTLQSLGIKINKEERNVINKLAFLYSAKEEDIKNTLAMSLDLHGKLDIDKFKDNLRNIYLLNNGSVPSLVYKDEIVINEKYSKKERLLYTFKSVSPYVYFKSKCKGGSPSKSELMIIEDLLTKKNLSPEVINVLISYVLQVNKQKFPRSYVETIASSWKRRGYKTAEEAMEGILKEKEKRKASKSKTIKTSPKLPEWFDEDNSKEENKENLDDILKEIK